MNPNTYTLFIDEREKKSWAVHIPKTILIHSYHTRKPRRVHIHTQTLTLPTADYCLAEGLVGIERKNSLDELAANLFGTASRARFLRSLDRLASEFQVPRLIIEARSPTLTNHLKPHTRSRTRIQPTDPQEVWGTLHEVTVPRNISVEVVPFTSLFIRRATVERIVGMMIYTQMHFTPPEGSTDASE